MSETQSQPHAPGMHTVTPHLVCAGGGDAIDFYRKAFNAEELARFLTPQGKLMHGCIRIGDSLIMIADEFPEWGSFGPNALKGSSVTIHLNVADADKQFQQAIDAGCTSVMPLEDMFWGDRYGIVKDPFGHLWSIATHVRDVSPEEIQQAISQMGSDCGPKS
ncbi:MAG TPA: VOC family protein [Methylophilaceae bacterium]|nr:VOC family protein [Methylophilaceae bacterium]